MFLDRFSALPGSSTSPATSQRSYSPAPRRPNHLASGLSRPPLNPRSSSLTSLVSKANSSTNSLPGTSRLPIGSSLKQSMTAPPDAEAPILVLEKIVGASLHKYEESEEEQPHPIQRPEELIEDVDFDGLSLTEFAKTGFYNEDLEDLEDELDLERVQSAEECEYVRLRIISRSRS